MATQKASLESFSYNPVSLMNSSSSSGTTLTLIRDPYSGKLYGDGSLEETLSSLGAAAASYQQTIKDLSNPLTQPTYSLGNTAPTVEELTASLSRVQDMSNSLNSSSYVHKPQVTASFNAHPDGWNKYFESSYKSPRIAEDNASLTNQHSQGNQDGKATGSQLINNNLGIRKEIGTGVGKSSVGLNPFGKLDSGLNI